MHKKFFRLIIKFYYILNFYKFLNLLTTFISNYILDKSVLKHLNFAQKKSIKIG